jgi:hypothetical protein
MVRRIVELLRGVVALARVFPHRVVGLVEEERRVAGVFGVDVDLAAGERLAHDRRRAERDLSVTAMPCAFSTCAMTLPSRLPSVSIFDDTTTGVSACAPGATTAAANASPRAGRAGRASSGQSPVSGRTPKVT